MLDTVTTRSPMRSSSRPVSAKCPRWLTPNWVSKPSAVRRIGMFMMPALLTSTSKPPCWAAKSRTEARLPRSSAATVTSPSMPSAICWALAVLRQAITTLAPLAARVRVTISPSPPLAPVTTKVRPCWSGVSASVIAMPATVPAGTGPIPRRLGHAVGDRHRAAVADHVGLQRARGLQVAGAQRDPDRAGQFRDREAHRAAGCFVQHLDRGVAQHPAQRVVVVALEDARGADGAVDRPLQVGIQGADALGRQRRRRRVQQRGQLRRLPGVLG